MLRRTRFSAIGTSWQLAANTTMPITDWKKLLRAVHIRIEQYDQSYSRFRSDSLVSEMARNSGSYPLPSDGFKLLTFYEKLYLATNGLVTPLIGQALSDAGYDASYSLVTGNPSIPPRWEDILSYTYDTVIVYEPCLLDFGAAGKGHLVDIIADMLEAAGLLDYILDASGDIRHRSTTGTALEIGLENPYDTSEVVGVAHITNQSLCASAGSKRAWGDYTHILNPKTLRSPSAIAAVWVVADDTMTADGIATALFFADASQLAALYDFEYALLNCDMQLTYSHGFPVNVFEAQR